MSLMDRMSALLSWISEVPVPQKKMSPGIGIGVQHNCSVPNGLSNIVRIAGLSGAIAVALGAYGSHKIRDDVTLDIRRKKAFETATLYHLIHTVALLGAPKARYPLITSTVFVSSIIMFCGPCYHYSITGQESTRRFAPIGGVMFILGWLTFMF